MPAGGALPRPAFALSLVLFAFNESCVELECPLALWMHRADQLGALLQRHAHVRVALDVFSPCRAPANATTRAGVALRTHTGVPAELERALAFAPEHARLTSAHIESMAHALRKWAVYSLTDVECAAVFEVDMDPLDASLSAHGAAVAADWLGALARFRRVGAYLGSLPGPVAPVNGGFLLAKPSARLFAEGVQVLLAANASGAEVFNVSHGWALAGPPREVVPRSDGAWAPDASNSSLPFLRNNRWAFVKADADQGFFYFMLRVRHRLGVDLCMLPELEPTRPPPRVRYRLPHYYFAPHALMPSTRDKRCRPVRARRASLLQRLGMVDAWVVAALTSFQRGVDEALVPPEVGAACTNAWTRLRACVRQQALAEPGGFNWLRKHGGSREGSVRTEWPMPAVFAHSESGGRCAVQWI